MSEVFQVTVNDGQITEFQSPESFGQPNHLANEMAVAHPLAHQEQQAEASTTGNVAIVVFLGALVAGSTYLKNHSRK